MADAKALGPHVQVIAGWLDGDGCLLSDPDGILYRRTFTDWEEVAVPDDPDDRRLFPSPDPQPKHFWNDPDGDGHDCEDCPEGSIWRCDEAAHPPAPDVKIGAELRQQLERAARARRRISIPNKGLA